MNADSALRRAVGRCRDFDARETRSAHVTDVIASKVFKSQTPKELRAIRIFCNAASRR